MADDRGRRVVAQQGASLCSGYLAKITGDELAYVVLVIDLVDGKSGNIYASDIRKDDLVIALRKLATEIESGERDELRAHQH